MSGLSVDISPSAYNAYYIRINQDTVSRKYLSFTERPDSLLSHYFTNISNGAAFTQLDYKLTENLRLVGGIRFDVFRLAFRNYLPPSAFSGSPNTTETYKRFTPKAGLTWQPHKAIGFYANYSEGFVAPQVTELFNGVKVPDLKPQTFFNYEAGGWVVSGRERSMQTGAFTTCRAPMRSSVSASMMAAPAMRNAGKTKHQGIEYGFNFCPTREWMFRISGANSTHRFVNYSDKGVSYNGKTMNGAPAFTGNTELAIQTQLVSWLSHQHRVAAQWRLLDGSAKHGQGPWVQPAQSPCRL